MASIHGAASQINVSDLTHARHTAIVASQLSLIGAASATNPDKAIHDEASIGRNTGVYLSLSTAALQTLNSPTVSAALQGSSTASLDDLPPLPQAKTQQSSQTTSPVSSTRGGYSSQVESSATDSTVGTQVNQTA